MNVSTPPPYQPGAGTPPPYQPASYPPTPPPARRSNTIWWVLGGGIIAVLALCICATLFSFGALGGGVFALFRATAGPRDAVTAYYEAVAAQDYVTAQSYLNATQRAAIAPRALEATWQAREGSNGPVAKFDITNTSISSSGGATTATITGTLRYSRGATEAKTITLVKEGDAWKISSAP